MSDKRNSISRRTFGLAAAGAVAAPFVVSPSRAQGITTLKLHHFLGPQSNGHAKMLAPWAKMVEAASGGKLKIDIYPAMQLGGTPPQLFDQVRDGVADIVWTLPGSTPGRFPLSEVFELPFIGNRLGLVNAQASQAFATKYMAEETKEVKLLSYWAHDGGLIHANKSIKTMEDMKGLKLRNPTRLAGEALKALGATSVGMPVPQVPESLAQRVIDGAVVPWEVVPAVKVHELVKFHTEIPGSPALYAASFFLAMNKAKYDGLAPELKAAIDKSSGMVFAALAGKMWDDEGVKIKDMVQKRGNTITSISEEEKQRWIKATEPVHTAWIELVKGKGIDGAKMIAEAKALVAQYAKG